MRTARAHPETRERLYEAAQRLMLEKGYPATTVDEICAQAGLTKGSFFHYFTSKDHLGRELLERYISHRMEELAPVRAEPDPLRRLYAHLDDLALRANDPQHRHGCIMGIFAQELGRTNPEMARLCADAFGRWTALMERDLEEAMQRYVPRVEVDARTLAEHFLAIMQGSLILARVSPESRVVEHNVRHFRKYVEMIFGQPA